MKRVPRRIESMRDLTRLVPSIVKEINADSALALRAAANPLLAVEELGYELEPSLRLTAERRVRFPESIANQLTKLADHIYSLAGEQFDIEADDEVRRVLFETLELSYPDTLQQKNASEQTRNEKRPTEQKARTSRSGANEPVTALLLQLQGAHPIVEPLMNYRELSASEPRLAPPELYERIRRGEIQQPITHIQYRLKRAKTSR